MVKKSPVKKKVGKKTSSKKVVKKTPKKVVRKTSSLRKKVLSKSSSKKVVKKPSKKVAKKPSKKVVKKSSKKVVKKPSKKVAKKSSKKAVKKPSKKVAKKSSKKVVKKSSPKKSIKKNVPIRTNQSLKKFEEMLELAKATLPDTNETCIDYFDKNLVNLAKYRTNYSSNNISKKMVTLPNMGTAFTIKTHDDIKGVFLKNLYNGNNSKVFLVEIKIGKNKFVKILKISLRDFDDLKQEADILKQLQNPYMFEIVKIQVDKLLYKCAIMDYIGSPISSPHINRLNKEKLFKKSVKELERIHSLNILHQDIKPLNILYNEFTNNIYYIDYGFSVKFDNKPVRQEGYTIDFVSPYQMVEMILVNRENYYYNNKKIIFGYRKLDDYMSLIYSFADLEGYNPHRLVQSSVKKIDTEFVKKFKNRDEKSFSKFYPKTIFEKLYSVFFNLSKELKDESGYFTNKYFLKNKDVKKWIDGKKSEDLMKMCTRACSIYYKIHDTTFDTTPTYLQKFVSKFKKHMITDIEIHKQLEQKDKYELYNPTFSGFY